MIEPTPFQLDALKEIVNTGVGKAAASLNELVEAHIVLEVPRISLFRPEDHESDATGLASSPLSCVQLGFHGVFNGTAALVFPPVCAVKLVAALTGEDPETPSLNAVMAGTLNEVGNIIINSVIGTIGNILGKSFDYSLPNYLEGRLGELLRPSDLQIPVTVLLVQTRFCIKDLEVEGNIYLIFELGSFDVLMASLDALCV
jgi:chemotaxis protein CheC